MLGAEPDAQTFIGRFENLQDEFLSSLKSAFQSQQIPDALAELGALVRAITAVSITQVVFSD